MIRPVVETFQITGCGLIVALEGTTDLLVGRPLVATVHRVDGTELRVEAWKEGFHGTTPEPRDLECFLLTDLVKDDVPTGSSVSFAPYS